MASILRSPAMFQQLLDYEGLLERFYNLMAKDDTAEVVMEALEILKRVSLIPPLVKNAKNKRESVDFRNEGNKAFRVRDHQKALEFYNRALMMAPKGSEELVLAYSNRSALHYRCKQFQACLKDIETCLALGCSENLKTKLIERRNDANREVWTEKMLNSIRYSPYVLEYFNFNERRNPQIPCASTDVGVILQSGVPSVVAAVEVKVGKILAVEQSFVSVKDKIFNFNSCLYCHKMSLNLFPCEGCSHVLFCSKECQQTCLNEYHGILCAIIEISVDIEEITVSRLALQATIKMRNKYGSWDEFGEAVSKLGLERMRVSSINEIFDGKSNSSMLTFKDDLIPVHGQMYNASFECAIALNYLGHMKSYFPARGKERDSAMRSFARLLMYFSIYSPHTQIASVVSVVETNRTGLCHVVNFGFFPFIGKLKYSCTPNVLTVGLNNKLLLVALQHLKPGTELTIAPLGHWLDNRVERSLRWRNLYALHRIACDCAVCTGKYELIGRTVKPTETQIRLFQKLNAQEQAMTNFSGAMIPELYPKVCKALAFFSDLQFSNEYKVIFILFRKCLIDMQDCISSNLMYNEMTF